MTTCVEEEPELINKILIANRGEIARRIIRTCKKINIRTVAIYSDADQHMPHVLEADEAVRIGEAPVAKSYLNIDAIIKAAIDTQADAIHPGYGLLSENGAFASACKNAGLIFIGPDANVITQMGDKITARKIMENAGVIVVPGYHGEIQEVGHALEIANQIGYPVMLKASAGGGGIGMQACYNDEEIEKAFATAKGRAKAYFGNDQMFIEKLIEEPHHIEVQILADTKGNVLHLYERECSIQRRHQKVIEESPSPSLDEHTRIKICKAAVDAAQAAQYTGAGTVEFIMDGERNYYFLEMNTRLQVEHPVTEVITGLDLVEWQIRIANGEEISFSQSDVEIKGHGIEFRIYAEDPKTFFPSPGKVSVYNPPIGIENVRIDDAIHAGNEITPYYDPMIAKCIVWGNDRAAAIINAKHALSNYEVEGIKTNLPLHLAIVKDKQFVEGIYTTNFLNEKQNML